jgi:hypothetical protein
VLGNFDIEKTVPGRPGGRNQGKGSLRIGKIEGLI